MRDATGIFSSVVISQEILALRFSVERFASVSLKESASCSGKIPSLNFPVLIWRSGGLAHRVRRDAHKGRNRDQVTHAGFS